MNLSSPLKKIIFSKKSLKIFFIWFLVFCWLFSGWPSISPKLYLPPKIEEARAAFSSPTARGSAVENSSDGSIAVSPTANITVGKILFVAAVTDNTATADGASTDHSSLADTDNHTWNKVFEETDSAGAAADGSTTSLWWTRVQTQIDTSDSITLTLGTNRTDKIIALVEVTVAAGYTITASTDTPTHSDSATSLSETRSSLTSREYLFFGLFGAEGEDTAKTPIANYSELHDLVSATAGNADTNVQMHIGTRILTGTGDTWTSSAVTFTNGIQSLPVFFETASAAPTTTVNQPDGTGDTIAENATFTVNYDLADTDDVVTANFAYDTDAAGYNGTLISGCINRAEGTGVTCSWDTTGVSPGTYYVHATTTDGATAAQDYSSGVMTINDAPTISIAQPDGTGDTVTVGDNYNVTYTLADTDDTVTVAFYYDTNNSGLDGTAISGACASAAEGTSVTCSWNTTGVSPGSYYVYGLVNDGVNPQVNAYSPGQITINSSASTLTFSISDNSIGFGVLSSTDDFFANGAGTGSATEVEAHTIIASTNATNGYSITVNGATLTYSSATIDAIGCTNTASTTGTEQFGLRATASGGDGSVSVPYAAAGFAFCTSSFPDEIASDANGNDVSTTYSLRYIANITSNTDAGAYSATLTYVIVANF